MGLKKVLSFCCAAVLAVSAGAFAADCCSAKKTCDCGATCGCGQCACKAGECKCCAACKTGGDCKCDDCKCCAKCAGK